MKAEALLDSIYAAPGLERVDRLEHGLPSSVFAALAAKLALSSKALAKALGISERTLRTRSVHRNLTAQEATLSFQAYRVFRQAAQVLGGEENGRTWMASPQRALGERRPLDLLSNPLGVEAVLNVLAAIDEGVYL